MPGWALLASQVSDWLFHHFACPARIYQSNLGNGQQKAGLSNPPPHDGPEVGLVQADDAPWNGLAGVPVVVALLRKDGLDRAEPLEEACLHLTDDVLAPDERALQQSQYVVQRPQQLPAPLPPQPVRLFPALGKGGLAPPLPLVLPAGRLEAGPFAQGSSSSHTHSMQSHSSFWSVGYLM